MRLCLLMGLLWPAAASGVVIGERAPCRDAMPAALRQSFPIEALEIIGINVDPAPDAGRRGLATLDFRYPRASDPAADSAIIHGVEKLSAAFIVGAEGHVRHIQRGAGQKDMGKDIEQAEATISALIETSFDAVSPTGFEGRTQQDRKTVRLNTERLPRMPGPGVNAP